MNLVIKLIKIQKFTGCGLEDISLVSFLFLSWVQFQICVDSKQFYVPFLSEVNSTNSLDTSAQRQIFTPGVSRRRCWHTAWHLHNDFKTLWETFSGISRATVNIYYIARYSIMPTNVRANVPGLAKQNKTKNTKQQQQNKNKTKLL